MYCEIFLQRYLFSEHVHSQIILLAQYLLSSTSSFEHRPIVFAAAVYWSLMTWTGMIQDLSRHGVHKCVFVLAFSIFTKCVVFTYVFHTCVFQYLRLQCPPLKNSMTLWPCFALSLKFCHVSRDCPARQQFNNPTACWKQTIWCTRKEHR